MRAAIVGQTGQLAQALRERGHSNGIDIINVGRPDLDLVKPDTVLPGLAATQPDIVINAAAYTAVDAAEGEPTQAFAVNANGAGAVAQAAADLGVPLIHLSTDYVFDGQAGRPYREDDRAHPLSAYGRSKLAGEEQVAAATANHVIARIAWVYSPFGKNFVRTMLRLAAERQEIAVVADQTGSPSSAFDLADAIIAIARKITAARNDPRLRGIIHVAPQGTTSWAGFADAIFVASSALGGPRANVRKILTSDYPTAARRPPNSMLATDKLADIYGIKLPNWQDALPSCVERILRQERTS